MFPMFALTRGPEGLNRKGAPDLFRRAEVRPFEGRPGRRSCPRAAGFEHLQPFEEDARENHPPLACGFGNCSVGCGQFLARPPAKKANVRFHVAPLMKPDSPPSR